MILHAPAEPHSLYRGATNAGAAQPTAHLKVDEKVQSQRENQAKASTVQHEPPLSYHPTLHCAGYGMWDAVWDVGCSVRCGVLDVGC